MGSPGADVLVFAQADQCREVDVASLAAVTSLTFKDTELESLPEWVTALACLKELVLSNNKLTDLPDLSPLLSLTKFVLSESGLPKDVAFFWSRYVFPLRKIDMSYLKLQEFPDVITRMYPLMRYPPQHLDLSDNHISTLPDLFSMKTLESVRLEGNPLHPQAQAFWSLFNIPSASLCIYSVPQMKSIRLYVQSNTEYAKNIGCFQVKETPLMSIPAVVGTFTNLRVLSVPDNSLTSLPSFLSNLSSLTYLNAMRNKLTCIPPEVSGLKSLNYFDVGINKISQIPEEVTSLKNLSTFMIYGNKISTVPEFFARLLKLTHVDFEKNEISSLPKSFKRLQKIQNINFCNNKFLSFPEMFDSFTGLKHLNIARCQMSSIPDFISSLVGLTLLDFSENLNASIPSSLYQMTFLRCLRIGKKCAGKIPNVSNFRNLLDFSIKYDLTEPEESLIMSRFFAPGFLNLSKCELTSVHPSITNLPLTGIDLSGNLLTEIPSFVEGIEELRFLDLSKNPLSVLPVKLLEKPTLQVIL